MTQKIADSGFSNWTPDRLPELCGKVFVITGGNSGIGLEAAKMLGEAGADVVIACRNPDKATKALEEIQAASTGKTEFVQLDLSDMSSVRKSAADIRERCPSIDGLINNAGIMQTPQSKTKDGFELQFGTNHLGHFLLTGLLLDLMEKVAGRIVVVSSIAHKFGNIHFDDLMLAGHYTPTRAYGQSKLANLMFALELDRRLKASNSPASCIACHPGYAATHLQSTGPTGLLNVTYKLMNAVMAQPARMGAVPTVLAAAGKEAKAGAYYGPQSMGEARGRVSDALVADQALDEAAAARLWAESEKLVGLQWPALASPQGGALKATAS
ncbi:MAG: oxidoreductase [Methyloligellaceae bacterium]